VDRDHDLETAWIAKSRWRIQLLLYTKSKHLSATGATGKLFMMRVREAQGFEELNVKWVWCGAVAAAGGWWHGE